MLVEANTGEYEKARAARPNAKLHNVGLGLNHWGPKTAQLLPVETYNVVPSKGADLVS